MRKRELSEETGYEADRLKKLSVLATTVGFSNELIHMYVAEGLKPGVQHPDEDEFIHLVRMPLQQAVEMIWDGRILMQNRSIYSDAGFPTEGPMISNDRTYVGLGG